MHTEDMVGVLLVLWGNRLRRAGGTVPWGSLEEGLRVDLTATGRYPSTVAILGEEGAPVPPSAWLPVRAGAPESGFVLLERRHLASRAPTPPFPVPDRMQHAFAGTATTGVGVVEGGEVEAWHPAVRFPPRTSLRWADLEAFVASRPDAAALRERLLWEDAHNLHVTDGADWDRFVEAVRAAEGGFDEVLVQAMGRVTGNVRFAGGTDRAWADLVARHRNPDFAPQFGFLPVGRRPLPPPAPAVEEQARRLGAALAEAERVAERIAPGPWGAVFREAREILSPGRKFEHPLATLVAGTALPDPALRLLVAAGIADVFGGMGSWNDVVPEDADRADYEAASENLFRELVPSLRSATDASR